MRSVDGKAANLGRRGAPLPHRPGGGRRRGRGAGRGRHRAGDPEQPTRLRPPRRPCRPGPSPSGDSVPYGHGLANPYLTPQIGLPATAVSQGPSTLGLPEPGGAGPRAHHVRAGDQLPPDRRPARRSAGRWPTALTTPAATGSAPSRPGRPGTWPTSSPRPTWSRHPARLVLLQDGADDIDFSACLEYELARVLGVGIGLGTPASPTGRSRRRSPRTWPTSAPSLAHAIETLAPHASTVAVLDYYQPIPEPSQIASGTARSGLHTNLVCSGLKPNAASTYAAAQVVLAALNDAVAGAVADARAAPRQQRHPGRRVGRPRRARHVHGPPMGLLG